MDLAGSTILIVTLVASLAYLVAERRLLRRPAPARIQRTYIAIAIPLTALGLSLLLVG